MRKKSHISLAGYLVHQIPSQELRKYKKAFYIGNILPDCKPSFLTTKHEFSATYAMVQDRIRDLSNDATILNSNTRSFCIQLGKVVHYLADYFTFPHNLTYDGGFKDHCYYEKDLKFGLRHYIRSGQAAKDNLITKSFHKVEDLFLFIHRSHQDYLMKKRNVQEDCEYIVRVCHIVVHGILAIINRNEAQKKVVVAV